MTVVAFAVPTWIVASALADLAAVVFSPTRASVAAGVSPASGQAPPVLSALPVLAPPPSPPLLPQAVAVSASTSTVAARSARPVLNM
ncbi:hypothetical protein ACFV1L_26620 [Kitasatospora sp. NPDC059646]|uniref:hypothetical protein n=1 Tax=Kitasatospora sp. NPDC059646 TaxID=3346893 RepID=UPI003699407E